MKLARLHGPHDIRIEDGAEPGALSAGEVLLRVGAVGICGSDLHMYTDARIGDTVISSPMILGHEFMGVVAALSEGASGGDYQPLRVGQRVAVDPATPCYACEMCELGHPNLCINHTFHGVYPTDGALRECMIVRARNCFPIPDSISDGAGTLLETLGIAIHSVDLGHLRVAETVAVIGCGPVGMLILKVALLHGASTVYAFDKLPWRVEKARQWGAQAYSVTDADPLEIVMRETNGRGVDVVFEAAWADETVQLAADMARLGGRVVLVGIPGDDRLTMTHSTGRRKGLTFALVRRMKHTYPRAVRLATSGALDLDDLVSETVTLDQTPAAFRKNIAYEAGVNKIVVAVAPR
jgi:L-iditol 2-dehydrogenase